MGLIHPQTMLKDAPTSFGDYTPDNYLHDFKGPVSAETALITSRNIPAITLAREISNPDLYDMLHMVGIPLKSRKHYGLSIVLGGAEVRMRDLIRLYAGLANRGLLKQIKEIRAEGDRDDSVYRLFSHASAYITCSILAKNYLPFYETRRFGKNKDQPVAFKTGTSIGFKDCWSIGIFDNLIIAVWIGNFDGYGNPAFIGRKMAAPLMFEIIDSLRRNNLSHPTDLFETIPDNVTEVEVCQVSGRIKGEHCTKQATTLFIPRVSPIEKCKIHRLIYIDPKTGFQTTADNPDARKEVWEFWTSDLLQLFQQAGLPRRIPPPFPPHTDRGQTPIEGFAPKIVSPLTNTEYVIRFDVPEYRDIPLQAIADADIDSLYWFVNKRFIGVCSPDETLAWEPDPGTCAITVVDSRGRSDTREITISQVK
jgi:penicillin-binding protein 1C